MQVDIPDLTAIITKAHEEARRSADEDAAVYLNELRTEALGSPELAERRAAVDRLKQRLEEYRTLHSTNTAEAEQVAAAIRDAVRVGDDAEADKLETKHAKAVALAARYANRLPDLVIAVTSEEEAYRAIEAKAVRIAARRLLPEAVATLDGIRQRQRELLEQFVSELRDLAERETRARTLAKKIQDTASSVIISREEGQRVVRDLYANEAEEVGLPALTAAVE